MRKAESNVTSTRRRFLTGAAFSAATVAVPAAKALAGGRDDTRLFSAIAAARALMQERDAAGERATAARERAEADPELPSQRFPAGPGGFIEAERARGSMLGERALARLWHERQNRVWDRHGAKAAFQEWNALCRRVRVLFERIAATRANTAAGASAKAALFLDALQGSEPWDEEDAAEVAFPSLAADLARLAAKTAA